MRGRRVFLFAFVGVLAACGSEEPSSVPDAARRAEILADLGLSESFDPREAALEAREFVYATNHPIPPEPSPYGHDLYAAYTALKGGSRYYCDGMANVYHFMLSEMSIPSRVVVIGDRDYFTTGSTLNTQTTVDVDLGGWVSMDPTFNVTYRCDGQEASTVDLVSCRRAGKEITWTYGEVVYPERSLEGYYIPLTDLLYDYRFW